jgi:putative N-acetylmannosamine-6-phosphate epimerase
VRDIRDIRLFVQFVIQEAIVSQSEQSVARFKERQDLVRETLSGYAQATACVEPERLEMLLAVREAMARLSRAMGYELDSTEQEHAQESGA